jgi:hypothetical protein
MDENESSSLSGGAVVILPLITERSYKMMGSMDDLMRMMGGEKGERPMLIGRKWVIPPELTLEFCELCDNSNSEVGQYKLWSFVHKLFPETAEIENLRINKALATKKVVEEILDVKPEE